MTRSEIRKTGESDTVDDHGYPFWAEWKQQQAEPLPDFGPSIFDKSEPSLFAKNRFATRTDGTLTLNKKEVQNQ